MIYKDEKPAILMFQDGTYFEGIGLGAIKKVMGEITFTAIPGSGYVESLTDPSFIEQLIVFTYPSIGNYGVPDKIKDEYGILRQFESDSIKLKGIIYSEKYNNETEKLLVQVSVVVISFGELLLSKNKN